MGIDFVIIVENRIGRTQREVNAAFGVHRHKLPSGKEEIWPEWECFTWEGKSYASWVFTPRYFDPEIGNPKWEALRKYLVRVREFFGGGEIHLSNDAVCLHAPDEGEEFWLPLPLEEKFLAEPDLKKFPELAEVKELEGLIY